jgi:hypothetical protein
MLYIMSSTRTKNTPGNYDLEKWSYDRNVAWCTAEYRGPPPETNLPGDGLLAGNVSRTQLSVNSCDIESMLRGIGSTNLVSPQEPTVAQIKELPSLNVCTKIPLLIPADLYIQPNQRPLFN